MSRILVGGGSRHTECQRFRKQKLEDKIIERRKKAVECIPKNDSIKFPVNLLSPIHYDTDEIIHTQILTHLIKEDNEEGEWTERTKCID